MKRNDDSIYDAHARTGRENWKSIQASERQYQREFGSSPTAMIVASLAPGEPARYIAANDAYCDLAGYRRRELVGKDFLGEFHPEDQPALDTLIQQASPGHTDRVTALARLVHKDGATIATRLTVSAIQPSSAQLSSAQSSPAQPSSAEPYLTAFVEDISATQEARSALQQAEAELARTRRQETLGQLVGGIGHDFNNMLTVIANYASIVRDEISVAEATESSTRWGPVRWDVEQIEVAADRAKRLIKHMLAFARREQAPPVVVDLSELIGDVSTLLGGILGDNIHVDNETGSGSWPVEVERGLFEQAIVNVAVNSRDAMPAGGQITIAAQNLDLTTSGARGRRGQPGAAELAELLPGRYVQLTIADSGPGMDAIIADRAFEPFFTTKSGDHAPGLGLSAVRRFAVQAGGQAWLGTAPGAGTSVSIVLPAAPGSQGEIAAHPAAGDAATIVVVDDEPAIRDVAHRVLSGAGYHVVTAANGQEALSLIRDKRIPADLVLTDVIMPGMTGQALAAGVDAVRPGIQVLFMSGYEYAQDTADGWPDDETPVIGKPFTRAALLAKVTQLLSGSPGRQAAKQTPRQREHAEAQEPHRARHR